MAGHKAEVGDSAPRRAYNMGITVKEGLNMDREERTERVVQQLFHIPAAGNEGTDPEFMRILQGYIFGDVCRAGSLDLRLRELVTITALTALGALPQLKAHVEAGLSSCAT